MKFQETWEPLTYVNNVYQVTYISIIYTPSSYVSYFLNYSITYIYMIRKNCFVIYFEIYEFDIFQNC